MNSAWWNSAINSTKRDRNEVAIMKSLSKNLARKCGVENRALTTHVDSRGSLYELYRETWSPSSKFAQWNVVRSEPNVIRGVHVHPNNCDYLHVLQGSLLLGIHDLRPDNPADRATGFIELTGDVPRSVYIPNGVCHGFYFQSPTTYLYGLSTGWSMDEELGCKYNDPELGLDWPLENPILSERDTSPKYDYATMRAAWINRQESDL
jgi:dTDP-4-dehydrorhamnose 3,5-epimerase